MGNERDLLAAVYATPDDDATRLVLADALLEQGDPHGELIQIQIRGASRAERRREKQLLQDLRPALLGPLARVVSGEVFARGFLARCEAKFTAGQEELVSHPAWATVEELETDDSRLVEQPHVRPKRLRLIGHACAREVLGGKHVLAGVTSLCLTMSERGAEGLQRVTPERVPDLRRLGLHRVRTRDAGQLDAASLLAPFLDGPFGPRLEELFVRSDEPGCLFELRPWRAAAARVPVRFELPYADAVLHHETLRVERFDSHDVLNSMIQRDLDGSNWRPTVLKRSSRSVASG